MTNDHPSPSFAIWITGLPALALAVDPKDTGLMQRSPPRPKARILERDRMVLMFAQGLFMALITAVAFIYCLYGMDQDLDRARALTFTILVMVQLFHAFNCRSDRRSLFAIGPWTNKPLLWAVGLSASLQALIILAPPVRGIFKVVPFDPQHWLLAFGVGILPLVGMEALKAVWRGRQRV